MGLEEDVDVICANVTLFIKCKSMGTRLRKEIEKYRGLPRKSPPPIKYDLAAYITYVNIFLFYSHYEPSESFLMGGGPFFDNPLYETD